MLDLNTSTTLGGTYEEEHLEISKPSAEEADMEEALRRGYFNNFIWMYDTLSNILQEGHCRLNEDQSSVLLLPIKKWGTKAGRVLYEMRRDLWVQIKKDRAAA